MTTIEDFQAEYDRQWAALTAADAEAKANKTLVGRYIQHPFADGHAVYKITKSSGTKVTIEHVAIGDAWVLPAWGKKATIPVAKVTGFLNQRDLWANIHNSSDQWWESRAEGEIVHYHNSFGEYVRGVIVTHEGQKQMRSTALVGEWKGHDLPRRQPDGSIHYPYHSEKILAGEVMRPNASNMYECPEFSDRKRLADPRPMKPISLEVPAMTDAQRTQGAYLALQKAVHDALETELGADPTINAKTIQAALKAARTLLASNLVDAKL